MEKEILVNRLQEIGGRDLYCEDKDKFHSRFYFPFFYKQAQKIRSLVLLFQEKLCIVSYKMNSICNIGIVENEEAFRNRLKDELNCFEKITLWKNAEDCYRDEILSNLDILLIDIGLTDMSGIDLIRLIKDKFPDLKNFSYFRISS